MESRQKNGCVLLIWMIVLAIFTAIILENPAGILLGGVLGFLLAQVLQLRSRVRWLEERQQDLTLPSAPAVPLAEPRQPAATSAQTIPTPSTVEASVAPATVHVPPPVAPVEPAATPPVPPVHEALPPWPPPPSSPTVLDRGIAAARDWLQRGNPMARLGILLLFFGGVFFAKYAATRGWLPVEVRFLAIAVVSLGLLVMGWRLHERRAAYAQILQGGGIAGLYLTVFAATRLYQLLPHSLALGLLVGVAVASGIMAVAQNAQSLAVIGTAGGFLAPILLSTGSGNHVALFTYYAVLNLGIVTVAWFRAWRGLNWLGFFFTFSITSVWRALGYRPENLVSADAFLVLFFLLYVGVSILNALRQPPNLKGYVSGSLVFGLPVVAFTLHATLVSHREMALAWSALILGAFYLVLAWTLFATRRETLRLLVEAFAALGVIFASLAVPLAFDHQTTAAMWAVEGAGLLWLGLRQERKLARFFGMLLQLFAGGGYLIGLPAFERGRTFVDSGAVGATLLALSGLATGYWLFRRRADLAGYEAPWSAAATLWGTFWWFFGGIREIDRLAPERALGLILMLVAVTAGLLAALGRRRQWPLPWRIALLLPGMFTVPALFYLTFSPHHHPSSEWGFLGWPLLLIVHYVLLFKLDHDADPVLPGAHPWLHAAGLWVLALLLSWEGQHQVTQWTPGVWPHLVRGLVPALLLALLARQRPWPSWPVAHNLAIYRRLAAVPLAAWTVLYIMAINVSSDGDPVWLPYLPLLNPLDVVVAACLVVLGLYWLTRHREDGIGAPRWLIVLATGLTFLWLNAALLRALHHGLGTPLTARGILSSTLVQAALSIFWGLLSFAAMTLAARRQLRPLWIVGASLIAVVFVKLFLVDLSGSGTLARIVSFLSVGALLLITGYLSPLPPRRKSEDPGS